MDLQLNGKLVLVSGSTAGIGYAIAQTLAQKGAAVIVNGRQQASVDEALARLRADTQGAVHGLAADTEAAPSSSPAKARCRSRPSWSTTA